MQCPECSYETRVINTVHNEKHTIVRRRRECLKCLERFTTMESLKPKKEAKNAT